MPSFKLNNDQIEEIPVVSNEPFDLVKQLSLLMDKKISDAQVATGDMFAVMNSETDALKKGKNVVDNTYSSDPNSLVAPVHTSEQFYGMPPDSFVGQTPPPSSVYTVPVGLVPATGQTGAMVQSPPSPTPLASIPSLAAPG